MLKMVDGTGIIGLDMVCPLGVSAPQPPNYDRVELEGTGMLALPNSLDAPLERLELGGKTEQVQTSGKQMLNEELLKSLSNYTSNGLDYYYYRISGLEVGKKYTISRGDVKTGKNALLGISVNQESTNKAKFLVYDGLRTGYNNASITWEQTTGEYVDILFSVSGSVTSTTQERLSEFWGRISYVQLEKGTTATPYEPYTGGKPSPSPEYPQEIKNSGKWNEEKQKYEVDAKVTGKNLFDIEKAEASGGNLCTAKCENNIVKITAIETTTSKRAYAIVSGGGICLKAGKTYFLNGRKVGTSNMTPMFAFFKEKNIGELLKAGNFYTPNEDICIDIGIYLVGNAIGTGDTLEITDIIVCEGKDAAQYQPYTEQTITLTSDRPITKWDRLVEQGGEIGWLYQSKIASLTGKEEWKSSLNAFYTTAYNFMRNNKAKCSHYVLGGITNQEKNNIFSIGEGAYANSLWVRDTSFGTIQDFKEHLSDLNEKGAPIMVVSPSAQTEFVPLPQPEQNAIRALKTYYPTTVITVDGGELDPDIKVTYRKEI